MVPFSKIIRDNATVKRLQESLRQGADIKWAFVFGRAGDAGGQAGETPAPHSSNELYGEKMTTKMLTITWQRLLLEGETCSRCAATETAVEAAAATLRQVLAPMGVQVVLEKEALDQAAFAGDPLQSNLIRLNGRPLEAWLDLQVSQSPCCGPCGDAECRTVEADGTVHEAVPAALIIKAGLLAASTLLAGGSGAPCCPSGPSGSGTAGCCGGPEV
jgi:hypothetical protein